MSHKSAPQTGNVVVVVVVVVVVSLTFWSKVLFYFIFGASGAVFLTTP